MTLPIRWTARARRNFGVLMAYIAEVNPDAAEQLSHRIESAVLPLSEHPYLYRTGRVAGTREMVAHPNYLVVYRVLDAEIEVVNVLHARQRYP
jgi:toxin ParE1/3/4